MPEKKKSDLDLAIEVKSTSVDDIITNEKLDTVDAVSRHFKDELEPVLAADASKAVELQEANEKRRKAAVPLTVVVDRCYNVALIQYGDDDTGYLTSKEDANNYVLFERGFIEPYGYSYDTSKNRWNVEGLNDRPKKGSKLSKKALAVLRTQCGQAHAKREAAKFTDEQKATAWQLKAENSIKKLSLEAKRRIFWNLMPTMNNGKQNTKHLRLFCDVPADKLGSNPDEL